ncbi:hypothetical protein PsYK624_087890 [Phanerochaete sordida]|uniref:Uncharacterized protein n=1 Tax=Phanerochaete sordida TaxID=48140 RepID=A0A9P3LFH4_9APHY|nr:hypothetical protein PsYK624_087890 [Phanerochaete sordida]
MSAVHYKRSFLPLGEELAESSSTGRGITVRIVEGLILAFGLILFAILCLVGIRSAAHRCTHSNRPERNVAQRVQRPPDQPRPGPSSRPRRQRMPVHGGRLYGTSSWSPILSVDDEPLPVYLRDAPPADELRQVPSRSPPSYSQIRIEIAPVPPAYYPGDYHGPPL